MKKTLILSVIALSTMFYSCGTGGSASLKSTKDSVAYAIGSDLVNMTQLRSLDSTLNIDALVAGLRDAYKNDSKITPETAREIIQTFVQSRQEDMAKEKTAQFSKDSTAAAEASAKYMAEKEKEGFKKTANGILYKFENEGSSLKPAVGDTMKVNYTLTLCNGEKIDSSADHGDQPAAFPNEEGRMIKGFLEGINLFGKGGKGTIVIPAALGYGERGIKEMGGNIGPAEALTFQIELVDIVKPAKK